MRNPTTSITQLVKEVAKEVICEELEKRKDNIPDLSSVAEQFCQRVHSDLSNRNKFWSPEEYEMLTHEVRVAISSIANNHKRSFGAIAMKIRDKNLMFMGENGEVTK